MSVVRKQRRRMSTSPPPPRTAATLNAAGTAISSFAFPTAMSLVAGDASAEKGGDGTAASNDDDDDDDAGSGAAASGTSKDATEDAWVEAWAAVPWRWRSPRRYRAERPPRCAIACASSTASATGVISKGCARATGTPSRTSRSSSPPSLPPPAPEPSPAMARGRVRCDSASACMMQARLRFAWSDPSAAAALNLTERVETRDTQTRWGHMWRRQAFMRNKKINDNNFPSQKTKKKTHKKRKKYAKETRGGQWDHAHNGRVGNVFFPLVYSFSFSHHLAARARSDPVPRPRQYITPRLNMASAWPRSAASAVHLSACRRDRGSPSPPKPCMQPTMAAATACPPDGCGGGKVEVVWGITHMPHRAKGARCKAAGT